MIGADGKLKEQAIFFDPRFMDVLMGGEVKLIFDASDI